MKKASWMLVWVGLAVFACTRDKTVPFAPAVDAGLCISPAKADPERTPRGGKIDVESAVVTGKPVVSYRDILSYNLADHVMKLAFPADSLARAMHKYGQTFLVTLDSEKLYGVWIWSAVMSTICSSVVIVPDMPENGLKPDEIRIQLGYPSKAFFKGIDPRNNQSLVQRLARDGKAK
jgi:hypothetical protein